MPGARSRSLSAALSTLVLLLAACGGGNDEGGLDGTTGTSAEATPTATPAGDGGGDVKAPAGVSASKVNAARDEIVKVCQERTGKDKPSESESVGDLRDAADVLEENFRANKDEKFRRSPGTPAFSMRDRLRAAALVLQTRCGGAGARQVGKDLLATASGEKPKKKKRKKPKPTPTPTATATPTPTATATPEGATG